MALDQQSPSPRRLLLVEDDGLTAATISDLLTSHGFLVETVPGAAEAQRTAKDFDPDVALIDVSLGPGPTGADLALALSRSAPHIGLMLLTRHPDLRTAGLTPDDLPPGCAFLRKDQISDARELVAAIETVLADRADEVRSDQDPTRPFAELTDKQVNVLRLLALGMTNDAIAREMNAGVSTVERWIASIFRALDIPTSGDINPRIEAVRRYVAVAGLPEND